MPFYTFENKTTGEVYTESMPMAERESYLKNNPNIRQLVTLPNHVGMVGGIKNDGGWNEVMSRIGEHHKGTEMGDRFGSKSIKEVKTRNAVEKWRRKRAADKNK